MDIHKLVTSWPARLSSTTAGHDVVYELAHDLVAIHDAPDLPSAVIRFEDEGVTVCEPDIAARAAVDVDKLGPVYRQRARGPIAVPTGRVLVRLHEGQTLDGRYDELCAAGFDVEGSLAYAPHAAWLRPRTGRAVDGIRQLTRLNHLDGVENAEAQMLTEKRRL